MTQAHSMIGVALAFTLQSAPVDAFVAEGESLGRMTTVMAMCASLGYGDNPAMARRLNTDLERRALEAGHSLDVVMAAFRTGMNREKTAFRMDRDEAVMSSDELRLYATETIAGLKRRCREMADERPGLITDLDSGDQAADAQLATILRALDERPASGAGPRQARGAQTSATTPGGRRPVGDEDPP